MNDENIKFLIQNLPAIIAALLTPISVIVLGWMNLRRTSQAEAAAKIDRAEVAKETKTAITEVHDAVNGKMEKLLEVTRVSSKAEGKKEESDEQSQRDATPLKIEIVEQPVPVKVVEE